MQLAKEALWIGLGHSAAVIGLLVGIRLLTEFLPAATFGQFALVNATLALAQGILYFPLAQAALRYFPAESRTVGLSIYRGILVRDYTRRFLVLSAVSVPACVIAASMLGGSWMVTCTVSIVTLGFEGLKGLELTLANAARRQLSYSLLLAGDGLLRPLATAASAYTFGGTLNSALFGQLCGSALITLLFIVSNRISQSDYFSQPADPDQLQQRMRRFAAPLVITPVLAWLSGVSDRYIVGGLLGLADAGVYAAAYGLASRPLLLLSSVTEATFRQPYYAFAASGAKLDGDRIINRWLMVNAVCGAVVLALVWGLKEPITAILLAPEYHRASLVLPWVACGYVLLALSNVFERVAFAHGDARSVASIQLVCAVLALSSATIAALMTGLIGVAMVVPLYFGVQLIMTYRLARLRRTDLASRPLGK
jgi:O-antigen/teichoic acid export membrane protein